MRAELRLDEVLLRFAAALLDLELPLFDAVDLRAPEARLDALDDVFEVEPEVFFGDDERFAPLLLRDPPLLLRDPPLLLRFAAPLLLVEDAPAVDEPPLVSIDHFPDMTR